MKNKTESDFFNEETPRELSEGIDKEIKALDEQKLLRLIDKAVPHSIVRLMYYCDSVNDFSTNTQICFLEQQTSICSLKT